MVAGGEGRDRKLASNAARAASNLGAVACISASEPVPRLEMFTDGIQMFNPSLYGDTRQLEPAVDVVFIHGLRGGGVRLYVRRRYSKQRLTDH